jgi:hypothetical protein
MSGAQVVSPAAARVERVFRELLPTAVIGALTCLEPGVGGSPARLRGL